MVGIDDGNQRWPNRTMRKCAGIRAIKGTKRIRRGTSELIKKGGLQIGSSKIWRGQLCEALNSRVSKLKVGVEFKVGEKSWKGS